MQSDIETINVLYIEDDETCAGLTLEYLKRDINTKFNVIQVCTLEKGLNYLEKHCYKEFDKYEVDIILLDLVLPNSHGVATYNSVTEKCDKIPIVIISAYEDLALKCVTLGAQDYLVKPHYTQGALARVLRYSYERSKLERSRIEAEKKYRRVLDNTPVGYHNYEVKDNRLVFKGANPAAEKILGIDHEKIVDMYIEDAFPGLIGTFVPEKYLEIARTGKPFSEIRNYKDHQIERGYFKIHAFRSSLNHITVSFENITEQINTQKKLENLVEVTNACIYEIDLINKKFRYVNHVLTNKLGYTKEELMAMDPSSILTENSLEQWRQRAKELKLGKFIDNSFECELLTKDYEIINIMCSCEYLENEDTGLIDSVNVVAIDTTEIKKAKRIAEEKEEKIFDELETKIHQWRNELTIDIHQRKKESSKVKQSLKNLNGQSGVL